MLQLRQVNIMKKNYIIGIVIEVILIALYYYFALPPLNLNALSFWIFIGYILITFSIVAMFAYYGDSSVTIISSRKKKMEMPLVITIPLCALAVIFCGVLLVNLFCSPIFNARSYANRISVDETGDFTADVEEVNFNSLPLLDKDSSQKLGDRVMGQMSEFVSQYYVSDLYTQINFNNDIIRVTPLEYADFIKWFTNRDEGVKGYITVNSVTGDSELVELDEGMRYMPSAHFNENLYRKLRFDYPTVNFGKAVFELDDEKNPYWIVPTYSYTGVNLKTEMTGVVILDPISGNSEKYAKEDIPTWVDLAYNAQLVIELIDDWGMYQDGFWNSIFGQKNVVRTTDGYNYLAMNDDVYLYTGITSVLSDASNLGFILTNMRTGETVFYSVPGAEEYSAMGSAQGQVQQMNYTSTFPLLINLNNKPTYLVSLKDAAGLVKMYGFVDVADYQKVVVTDASEGIEVAAQNYLNSYADEISDEILDKKEITIRSITSATKEGNTIYYIVDDDNNKYMASIELGDDLPFASAGDKLTIGFYESDDDIIEIVKLH